MPPSILHLFKALLEDQKFHNLVQMLPLSSKKPFMQLVTSVLVDQVQSLHRVLLEYHTSPSDHMVVFLPTHTLPHQSYHQYLRLKTEVIIANTSTRNSDLLPKDTSTFTELEIIIALSVVEITTAFTEVDVSWVPLQEQFAIYVFRLQAPLVL